MKIIKTKKQNWAVSKRYSVRLGMSEYGFLSNLEDAILLAKSIIGSVIVEEYYSY